MADVKFAVTSFVSSTGAVGTTQDITIAGFGTPKAAIFIMSGSATDGTIQAFGQFSFGFTDGTNSSAYGITESGSAASDTASACSSSEVALRVISSGAGYYLRLGFDSWITDGVRVIINETNNQTRVFHCILIGGADVTAKVGNTDLGTGTSALDVNTVGFQPDLVFGHAGARTLGNSGAGSAMSVGAALRAASSAYSFSIQHGDSQSTSNYAAEINNNLIASRIITSGTVYDLTIGDYDSSGFSVTPSASAGSANFGWLALQFANSPDVYLGEMSWPTSGNYAETGPAFQPDFGMIFSCQGPTARNTLTTSNLYSAAISAFDTDGVYTQSTAGLDAQSNMVDGSVASSSLRILDKGASANAVLASGYAFDADGWDFTLTTNPAEEILGFALAIGSGATGTNVTTNLRNLTLTRYPATIAVNREIVTNLRTLTLTRYQATISVAGAVNVNTNLRSLTLTRYPATISVNRNITTNLRSLTLTRYPATVTTLGTTVVNTNLRTLTLTRYPASITRNVNVTTNLRSLTLTRYPATIDTAGVVEVTTNLRSLTLTRYPATISVNKEVLASVRNLTLTTYPVNITRNTNVTTNLRVLTMTRYPASITSGVAGQIIKINGLYIYHP